jgi:hypothetical protein
MYDWQDPSDGILLELQRERAMPVVHGDLIDPRCQSAFGESFASCSDRPAFACKSESQWVTALLDDMCNAGGQFDTGASLMIQPVVSEEVGWDLCWTALKPLDPVEVVTVSQVELANRKRQNDS